MSPIIYGALVASGAAQVFRYVNHQKVAILAYHGIHAGESDPLGNFDGLHLHVRRFERQMRYLAKHCRVVPIQRCLDGPSKPHRVVVTFDDAYGSIYKYAFPILKSLGLPATVFIPTDFLLGDKLMWWDRLRLAIRYTRARTVTVSYDHNCREFRVLSRQEKEASLRQLHALLSTLSEEERETTIHGLETRVEVDAAADRALYGPVTHPQIWEMAAYGISFQSHGTSHTSFCRMSVEQMWRQATESKARLEALLGQG